MADCAAIITDVGSPTGHMAILAREFGVPAIVGLEGASRLLEKGRVVTVHATACKVYEGRIEGIVQDQEERAPLAGSPAVKRLQALARHVTPLNLINPQSRDFTPANCRTLHDITRFIHEKVYHAMFRIGDMAVQQNPGAYTLITDLPVGIQLFDLGGGVVDGVGESGPLNPAQVVSIPMTSFLEGLTDRRIRWHQPRPVSMRGFLSVLGEGMAGLPPEARGVGSVSYAIVSDRYMNFSTKAGYHFSTVDVYCGQSQNKNYIHFQFSGGGAGEERRMRRVAFLSEVLSSLDFNIHIKGDRLVARLEKYGNDYIRQKLVDLGRLTMCSRQLDMLMDTDESAKFFAQMFLNGEFERF
jgi:pyruvate,water dikinase